MLVIKAKIFRCKIWYITGLVGATEALAHPCSQPVKRLLELAGAWPSGLGNVEPRPASACHTRRRLRPAEVDELVRGWETGSGVAQLAEEHGVHRSTVGRYLKKQGINTLEPNLTPSDVERAGELYAQGWTLVQVAVKLGVSKKWIRKQLVESGVAIRRGGRGDNAPLHRGSI